MLDRITIKERGAVPRRIRKAHNAASKEAWYAAGKLFHMKMRDRRFTAEHGRKAGYKPRRGEEPGLAPRDFWRSYTGQKLKKWHHKRPLEWKGIHGGTRARVSYANISTTSKGARVAYPGANTLNFKNRHSDINMAEEFRRLIPEEIQQLAGEYDAKLDAAFKKDQTTTNTRV